MDRLTKMQRTKNMKAVKCKGSKIEILLAKAMWASGLRYRKNDKSVFGKPDFVFKKYKIAVFCDSEFWHGYNWHERISDHKSNKEFWIKKIEGNIKRDLIVNEQLTNDGWIVLRFWGKVIEKNTNSCVEVIKNAIKSRKK